MWLAPRLVRAPAPVQAATAEYHNHSIAIRRAERIASHLSPGAAKPAASGSSMWVAVRTRVCRSGRVRNLMARAFDDVLNQREPAVIGSKKTCLMMPVRARCDRESGPPRLFCGDNRADVLNKIDATFLAGAAFALFVLASRAFVTQRSVATRAESRDVASIRATLKTFDRALRSRAWGCGDSTRPAWLPACLHGRVARFTGRESSTHMHILALQRAWNAALNRNAGLRLTLACV